MVQRLSGSVQSFLWRKGKTTATNADMHIRPATIADSDAIADILADGWARAYAGFMPPHILSPRADHAKRRAELREFIADEFNPDEEALLVAEGSGAVLGFIHLVLGDKRELGAGGFVSLLYVQEAASGKGIGRRLLAEGAGWLAAKTDGSIAIAAFESNPFHPFYAHLGGEVAKINAVQIEDFPCNSLVYLWPTAKALEQAAMSRQP